MVLTIENPLTGLHIKASLPRESYSVGLILSGAKCSISIYPSSNVVVTNYRNLNVQIVT